jgi:hypothetical protein
MSQNTETKSDGKGKKGGKKPEVKVLTYEQVFVKYISKNNDTAYLIGKKFNVDPELVLKVNQTQLPDWRMNSKLKADTEVIIPTQDIVQGVKVGDAIDRDTIGGAEAQAAAAAAKLPLQSQLRKLSARNTSEEEEKTLKKVDSSKNDLQERLSWINKPIFKYSRSCGTFKGTVTQYYPSTDTYTIVYADNDTETVTYSGMTALVPSTSRRQLVAGAGEEEEEEEEEQEEEDCYDDDNAASAPDSRAGGIRGSHHSEKRAQQQRDFEEEVVANLRMCCGEPTTWNSKKSVIAEMRLTEMWSRWVKAGHNEGQLVALIYRLKLKYLTHTHTRTGVAASPASVLKREKSADILDPDATSDAARGGGGGGDGGGGETREEQGVADAVVQLTFATLKRGITRVANAAGSIITVTGT